MINADIEINNLRFQLQNNDYASIDVENICDTAALEVNEIILDLVSQHVDDAITYAQEIGADQFLEELDIVDIGNTYLITTVSGTTDFSIPERQMLPHLLKNGKTAEDGSRYRVIPLKEGPKMTGDSFSTMQQQLDATQKARASLASNVDGRSPNVDSMLNNYRNALRGKSLTKTASAPDVRPVTAFRTASSKQDPNTQWVIPERNKDMTAFLATLNHDLENSINSSIIDVVERYIRDYL